MPHSILIDSNILISYLLTDSHRRTTIVRVVQFVLAADMRWIVPQEQLDELSSTIAGPKFVGHITPQMWAAFQAEIDVTATVVPRMEHEVVPTTRDRKDDYLIAAAFEHDVDILVSGDKDLLALADFLELPRILSPAQFVAEFGDG